MRVFVYIKKQLPLLSVSQNYNLKILHFVDSASLVNDRRDAQVFLCIYLYF